MQTLTTLASCVLGSLASPPPVTNGVAKPLPEGVPSNPPGISFLGRCQKMLDLQLAVYDGTKDLHKFIQDSPNKKARPEDLRASLKLAHKEKDIVVELAEAIDVLKAENAALAFSEALRELRKTAERVEGRLKVSDVGTDTQAVEQEIIDTLKEMVKALRKP